jgi:hypothetical protein
MKRFAIGTVALGILVFASAASAALPISSLAAPAAQEGVIQIRGGHSHGHGGGHFHGNRGRHLGWTRGRHRGW